MWSLFTIRAIQVPACISLTSPCRLSLGMFFSYVRTSTSSLGRPSRLTSESQFYLTISLETNSCKSGASPLNQIPLSPPTLTDKYYRNEYSRRYCIHIIVTSHANLFLVIDSPLRECRISKPSWVRSSSFSVSRKPRTGACITYINEYNRLT